MVSDVMYEYKRGGLTAMFQSALRFAVVSDVTHVTAWVTGMFQSALRFAVVSDQGRNPYDDS